ncbi:MAG TPA: hypothetical protein VFS15_21205 [Kofleriaceae bacterium]|nr:hypothetical protein [Kofleriaceae bacterium]
MEKQGEPREEAVTHNAPRWDVSRMASAYGTIATAVATADAVAINVGVVQNAGRSELKPELLHRIVLSPRTADKLHEVLGRLLAEQAAQQR